MQFFYNGYSFIYARRYEGQIVEGFRSAFLKVCLALIFLNTIVEKHTLNPEITLLNQFPARKALFKVPKTCNINFWIESNPPPTPLWNFSENSSDLAAPPFPYQIHTDGHLPHVGYSYPLPYKLITTDYINGKLAILIVSTKYSYRLQVRKSFGE